MIKVKVHGGDEARPYPKLMKSEDGDIVLFFSPGKGVVVKAGGDDADMGEYSDSWGMDWFEDFTGTITLSNGD